MAVGTNQTDYEPKDSFYQLRKGVGHFGGDLWHYWYKLVQVFTSRDLTFGSDKLPALAGSAEDFRSAIPTKSTYLAGLWQEDLTRGLFWGARNIRVPSRASGLQSAYELAEPAEPHAPSWSWASLDGPIAFYATERCDEVKILEVKLDLGFNDLAAKKTSGSIKIRGLLAPMRYSINPSSKIQLGRLSFEQDGSCLNGEAVMDLSDERRAKLSKCWALLSGKRKGILLVLKKVVENRFSRAGFCKIILGHVTEGKYEKFANRDFILI